MIPSSIDVASADCAVEGRVVGFCTQSPPTRADKVAKMTTARAIGPSSSASEKYAKKVVDHTQHGGAAVGEKQSNCVMTR